MRRAYATLLAGSLLLAWAGMLAMPASAGVPATVRVEYLFDGPVTATVPDATGRGHTLALSGDYRSTTGPNGYAVAFAPISRGASSDHVDLDPVGREFAVTVVLRLPSDTSAVQDTPNIVQKGTYSDTGQWKMQLKASVAAIQCRFKGTEGALLITSPLEQIDDGAWHTATCWRSGSRVGVNVDGVRASRAAIIGDVANSRPMFVGNKSLTSSTDQFPGEVGYLAFATGDGAAAASRAGAPAT